MWPTTLDQLPRPERPWDITPKEYAVSHHDRAAGVNLPTIWDLTKEEEQYRPLSRLRSPQNPLFQCPRPRLQQFLTRKTSSDVTRHLADLRPSCGATQFIGPLTRQRETERLPTARVSVPKNKEREPEAAAPFGFRTG